MCNVAVLAVYVPPMTVKLSWTGHPSGLHHHDVELSWIGNPGFRFHPEAAREDERGEHCCA